MTTTTATAAGQEQGAALEVWLATVVAVSEELGAIRAVC
jgi:hypothetical protein